MHCKGAERPTKGINDSIGVTEKKNNFSKAKTKICLSLHCKGANSYLWVFKADVYKFKAHNNIPWHELYLRSVSKDFMKNEQSEISLNDTVCDLFAQL